MKKVGIWQVQRYFGAFPEKFSYGNHLSDEFALIPLVLSPFLKVWAHPCIKVSFSSGISIYLSVIPCQGEGAGQLVIETIWNGQIINREHCSRIRYDDWLFAKCDARLVKITAHLREIGQTVNKDYIINDSGHKTFRKTVIFLDESIDSVFSEE